MKRTLTYLVGCIYLFSIILSGQIIANAEESSNLPIYTMRTESFYYENPYANSVFPGLKDGFNLESENADPDYMVVGIVTNQDGIYGYWITPINENARYESGYGMLYANTASELLDGRSLKIGDLLSVEGTVITASIYPTYYIFDDSILSYCGYGPDVFGDAFYRVMRIQSIWNQSGYDLRGAYEQVYEAGKLYDFPLVMGDTDASNNIDVVDCVALTRYLHGKLNLCDYGKIVSDLNRDGEIDVFDLGLLKHMLITSR